MNTYVVWIGTVTGKTTAYTKDITSWMAAASMIALYGKRFGPKSRFRLQVTIDGKKTTIAEGNGWEGLERYGWAITPEQKKAFEHYWKLKEVEARIGYKRGVAWAEMYTQMGLPLPERKKPEAEPLPKKWQRAPRHDAYGF